MSEPAKRLVPRLIELNGPCHDMHLDGQCGVQLAQCGGHSATTGKPSQDQDTDQQVKVVESLLQVGLWWDVIPQVLLATWRMTWGWLCLLYYKHSLHKRMFGCFCLCLGCAAFSTCTYLHTWTSDHHPIGHWVCTCKDQAACSIGGQGDEGPRVGGKYTWKLWNHSLP